jgi:hypothetical protein
VLADAGVEHVNAQVDDLIATGTLRRVLAFTELTFSNSISVLVRAGHGIALGDSNCLDVRLLSHLPPGGIGAHRHA